MREEGGRTGEFGVFFRFVFFVYDRVVLVFVFFEVVLYILVLFRVRGMFLFCFLGYIV